MSGLNKISSLSLASEVFVDGCEKPLVLDFSDKRFIARLLKLVKRYENIEEEVTNKFASVDEGMSEIDKLIAYTDIENEVLEDLKKNVNDTFNADVTGMLFGDCLPAAERYFPLFEAITPYIVEAKKRENDVIADITKKYGLDRISGNDKIVPINQEG